MQPQPQTEYQPMFGAFLISHFENHAARFAPRYVSGKTVLKSKTTKREYRVMSIAGQVVTLHRLNVRASTVGFRQTRWVTSLKVCGERLELV